MFSLQNSKYFELVVALTDKRGIWNRKQNIIKNTIVYLFIS